MSEPDHQAWSKSKKKRMRRRLAQKQKQQREEDRQRGSSSKDVCHHIIDHGSQAGGEPHSQHHNAVRQTTGSTSEPPRKKARRQEHVDRAEEISSTGDPKVELKIASSSGPQSALQRAFMQRLSGSRFRELNEELYTTTSQSAYERFTSNPELFERYHEGFRKQVRQWPVNPVNVILRWLLKKTKQDESRKRKENAKWVVADFGCGDAKLAKELLAIRTDTVVGNDVNSAQERNNDNNNNKKDNRKKKNNKQGKNKITRNEEEEEKYCPFEVHSFDLVSNGNPLVTACDMANVPLPVSSVDVGVFCLALMGTNIADFIREAHRVLRPDGILKIAEVRSRFESSMTGIISEGDDEQGGDGSRKYYRDDYVLGSKEKRKHKQQQQGQSGLHGNRSGVSLLTEFLCVMEKLGFVCTKKDQSNKMFILMEFEKNGNTPSKEATFTAKPCIYKRR